MRDILKGKEGQRREDRKEQTGIKGRGKESRRWVMLTWGARTVSYLGNLLPQREKDLLMLNRVLAP